MSVGNEILPPRKLTFLSQLAGVSYKITSGKEAMKLPGIGKQIGAKLDEFVATGKLKKIDKIEGDEVSTSYFTFNSPFLYYIILNSKILKLSSHVEISSI